MVGEIYNAQDLQGVAGELDGTDSIRREEHRASDRGFERITTKAISKT